MSSFKMFWAGVLGLAVSACSAGPADDGAAAIEAKVEGDASIWSSPEACSAALAARSRETHAEGAARVATWNIRWFPDGVMPSEGAARRPTNIAWLACSIAWLDVDVLVVEEILTHAAAREAMGRLTQEISRLTGGDWRSEIDRCPHENSQHQGYLYDARRVTLNEVHNFNWRETDSCNLSRRPGLAAHARFNAGLEVDLVAVHQKSGVDSWSYNLRQEALGRLPALHSDVTGPNVLIAGDFNTMGCTRSPCAGIDTLAEINELGRRAEESGFSRIENDLTCTEYSGPTYRKTLDHFVASKALVPAIAAKAKVSGYCADLSCASMTGPIARAQVELSDHCPVLLDLTRPVPGQPPVPTGTVK